MASKKGFYPWIKSIFGKRPPVEGVYAGPDMYNEDDDTDDDPSMEEVYAGPEYFERGDPEVRENGPEEEDVTETDGSEETDDEKDAENIKTPDAEEDPDTKIEEELPPAPAPRDAQNKFMFMCVYAGPEYFSGRGNIGMAGMMKKEDLKQTKCPKCGTEYPEGNVACPDCGERTLYEGGKVACPSCGAHIAPNAKFCENCGAKQA